MKVLCINKEPNDFFTLTIDKWYDATDQDSYYVIYCDLNFNNKYNKKHFLTLKQIRKQKLLKLKQMIDGKIF
jgi:hypothetical protein